jgi:hypothetical protein
MDLKKDFEGMEFETIEKMDKMRANVRILNGQIQSVRFYSIKAQCRINNYLMKIEETKANVDMARLASKVLRHNISEGRRAHEHTLSKTERLHRVIHNIHTKRSTQNC